MWEEPKFTDKFGVQNIVEVHGYKSGLILAWGDYDITYLATDAEENAAVCSFRVYVLREWLQFIF